MLFSFRALISSESIIYSSWNVPWGCGNILSIFCLHDSLHKFLNGTNRHFVAGRGLSTKDVMDSSRRPWVRPPLPLLPTTLPPLLSPLLVASPRGPWAIAIRWWSSREKKSNLKDEREKLQVIPVIRFLIWKKQIISICLSVRLLRCSIQKSSTRYLNEKEQEIVGQRDWYWKFHSFLTQIFREDIKSNTEE